MKIAEFVHSYGGINILGGHHATQMCDAILLNNGHLIDYVIIGDGEDLHRISNQHAFRLHNEEYRPNILWHF